MTLSNILYNILITPIQLLFEVIFVLSNKVINNYGLSIIILSLSINLLVLPLYIRADAVQEEEKKLEAKLARGVKHIKKTFKGDERMMILQTYYRQNGYKPTFVFKNAVSLFLQIPFFIAAYRFLSNMEQLNGTSFGILRDLGAPDALISIGGITINVLPIIMTTINLISCTIFTKDSTLKSKIQLYAMALFFLVFLYKSPSGLVFYWTLNNTFSLVKTICYKIKNFKRIVPIITTSIGIVFLGLSVYFFCVDRKKSGMGMMILGIALFIPIVITVLKKNGMKSPVNINVKSSLAIFTIGTVYMAILLGAVIPTAVLKSSPQEFINVGYYYNPLWYVATSICVAIGAFIVWFGVFYRLANEKVKYIFEISVWLLCGLATLNYMFFGKNFGILSSTLKYEDGMSVTMMQGLINVGCIIICFVVLGIVYKFFKKKIIQIVFVGMIALMCMCMTNVVYINKSVKEANLAVNEMEDEQPEFTLSKSGKNVIVMMLDRSMNEFIPYIMNEKPELKEQFAGFTYYANTLSYGVSTNFGTPTLFGGYEYTPLKMNERDQESLASKQNEALKLMPVIFDENGYKVTVCNPVYANYKSVCDKSIYSDYPDIKVYDTKNKFVKKDIIEGTISLTRRNFFCYSIMKIMPVWVQPFFYDNGKYYCSNSSLFVNGQVMINDYSADGMEWRFVEEYAVLENLPNITKITDEQENTFLNFTNNTPHGPMLLQEPDYTPKFHVDNTEYEEEHSDRIAENGEVLSLTSYDQIAHYDVNMATMLKVGEWLDYLRENDVYDNTRIIIVADHGRFLHCFDSMTLENNDSELYNIEAYYPNLMIKDFGSTEFKTSEEFMTNADVPTEAFKDLIENPINPFTGNEVNNDDKFGQDQYVLGSKKWNVEQNNGNQFSPGIWFAVHDDMRKKENWTLLQEKSVSPFEKK